MGHLTMNFYIFQTKNEADATEARIVANVRGWVQANMPNALSPEGYLRGRNAATGQLSDSVTMRWDEPRALSDGRFAILKPTADRVAPIPIEDALAGIEANEITLAEYETIIPQLKILTS